MNPLFPKYHFRLCITMVIAFFTLPVYNQTVIGGDTMDTSAMLDIQGIDRGVLLPRLTTAQRDAIAHPAFGLIIINTTERCIQINLGDAISPKWRCLLLDESRVESLDCAGALHSGLLIAGIRVIGASSVVEYAYGNGVAFNGQSIPSTGVSGLTASVGPLVLTNGVSSLGYSITGIATSTGTASFLVQVGGKICTLERSVYPPATVNGLNCASATFNGKLTSRAQVDSARFSIPYTEGNGGAYYEQVIPSSGITGLVATLTEGILSTGVGILDFQVSGTPSGIGTAVFAIEIGGRSCTIEWEVLPEILNLGCSKAQHIGVLTAGASASAVLSVLNYTNGNGVHHSGQVITSTGITGLTATLSPGGFAIGNGTLTYEITGIPSGAGTANFALSIGGQRCTLVRTVVPGNINSLDCTKATHEGELIANREVFGIHSTISYTGGNGGGYPHQSVGSSGVTGLIATLQPGNFALGNGELIYTISGIPADSGIASFLLNIGGKSCILLRTVAPSSIGDLDCTQVVHEGRLIADSLAIGVYSRINYTRGNGGGYATQHVNSLGVTGLTATLVAGNFVKGDSTLTYSISGTPSAGGIARFFIEIGGQNCTISRPVAPGSVEGISCTQPLHAGELISNMGAVGVYSIISYTGGNGLGYAAQSVASSGVTGLTATLQPGNLTLGNGELIYTISGIPADSGIANFALTVGGKSCIFRRRVHPKGTVSILDCSGVTFSGELVAGRVSEGTITLPYSGGNGGLYTAQTVVSTGVTGLVASVSAGMFTNGSGILTYTVSGTPTGVGIASFTISIGSQNCVITRLVTAIYGLDCANVTHQGELYKGSFSSSTSTILYTGGNGSSHNGQTTASSGITGLTATLSPGNFALGNGSLTYTITGTPSDTGIAVFALSIGGKSCVVTRVVVPVSVPVLTTNIISSITQTSAVAGGHISSGGGMTVTQKGVVYGTNPNPTLSNFFTIDGSDIGSFTSILEGLVPNTTYYVRAFATNSVGTAYGNQQIFVTRGIDDGLIAYFPFNGNAKDESGNGFHGTVNGAILTTDRKGVQNSAYSFSTNQSITVPNSQGNNTYPITISLWYNASSLPNGLNGNLFSKYIPGLWDGYQILIGDFRNVSNLGGTVNNGFGVNPFYLRSYTSRVIGYYDEPHFGQANISVNTWYHFVFTVDNSGGKIYVNGTLIDSHPWTGTAGACSNGLSWKIGGYYDTWYFGKIDDIRIYNRVLTQGEISYLFNY